MTRDSEARLLDFCLQQHRQFDPSAWVTIEGIGRTELAAVAHFLANVDWFGRQQELLQVAESLQPGCVGHFSDLARAAEFDASRFSHHLRRSLALHESGVS